MPTNESGHGFVGRLYRAADGDPPAGKERKTSGQWMLYFEIARTPRAPEAAGSPLADHSELVLYFGPRGAGAAASRAVRVLADGSMFEVRGGQAVPLGKASAVQAADRVSLWVPVPEQAIEGGKALRLGLIRIDEQGRRSAWPRPMLPWQTEPGRIGIDLSSWSPVKQ